MKNIFQKSITLLIAVAFCLSCIAFTVSAAGSTISFSNSKPKVNDSVTVNVTVSASDSIYSVQFSLKYNPDVLRYESGDGEGGAGILKVVESINSKNVKSKKFSFVFTAIAAGASNIQVTDCQWVLGMATEEAAFTGASASLTVSDAAKSDNANLKSLSLSKGTLSPKFSASKTSYTASVANDVTECKVYATAADSAAKVEVSGASELKVGKNTRTVTVTAASGAQKTYTVTITRLEAGDTASSEPENTSSEPETAPNPYEAVVDGAAYTVATDISGIALPNGFTATSAEYNGAAVAAAQDKDANYTVYYLKGAESDSYVPYLLSEDGNAFEKLKYAVFGANTYIFADFPENTEAPDGYYRTNTEIGGFSVNAYMSDDPEYADFYYLYCFFDGGFRTYRYDSLENVIQRSPEFKLAYAEDNTLPADAGFTARFNSLSSNAKIIVVGLLLAVVGAAALIILLIVKLVKSRNPYDGSDEEDVFSNSFDSVTSENGGEESDTGEESEETEDLSGNKGK